MAASVVCHGMFIYAVDTQRFLFLLRQTPGRYQYTWGICGGKQESDESARDCLIRETEEEIGIKIVRSFVPVDSFTSENGRFVYNTYFCAVPKEFTVHLNEEHIGFCWVPLDSMPRPLHPGVFNSIKEEQTRDLLLKLVDNCYAVT